MPTDTTDLSIFLHSFLGIQGDCLHPFIRKHEPILPPEPIDVIIYYMESRGLTRQDLESAIGSRARVAEILNRKRPLTLEMIRRLHEQLGIPAQPLIQPYALASA